MKKVYEICENRFEINSKSRIYCFDCSGESTRKGNETRKNQKQYIAEKMLKNVQKQNKKYVQKQLD